MKNTKFLHAFSGGGGSMWWVTKAVIYRNTFLVIRFVIVSDYFACMKSFPSLFVLTPCADKVALNAESWPMIPSNVRNERRLTKFTPHAQLKLCPLVLTQNQRHFWNKHGPKMSVVGFLVLRGTRRNMLSNKGFIFGKNVFLQFFSENFSRHVHSKLL